MNDITNTTGRGDVIPPPKPQRGMVIKGLTPSLPERGKIKIGMKGAPMESRTGTTFQPPKKLDHFLITTLERGPDGNFKRDDALHKMFGDKPTAIPIRLLYDDPTLNFPTRYAAFKGRQLWCSGDGVEALRITPDGKSREAVQCPCGRQDPAYQGNDKCKMNGALSAMIQGAGGLGGVWKFRTTSYNSIIGLLSSQSFLRTVTGGPLAGIPLLLTVRPKQATDPSGKQQTIYVVGLEFEGDEAALQDRGHQIALDRAKAQLNIQYIEAEARRQLMLAPPDVPLAGDDADDIKDEFYPDDTAPGGTAPTATTTMEGRPSMSPPTVTQQIQNGATDDELVRQNDAAKAEAEPGFELVDEAGLVVASYPDADAWARELASIGNKARQGQMTWKAKKTLDFNRDSWAVVRDHVQSDELVQQIEALMDVAAKRVQESAQTTPVISVEPAAASAAEPARQPLEMPLRDGRADSIRYHGLLQTHINSAQTIAAVDAIVAAEQSNLAAVLPGTRRAILGDVATRKKALAG